MIEIRECDAYVRWFARLKDREARARILIRVRRLSLGNPGDTNSVGGGVSELRIDCGPGYRVYFLRRGSALIFLLGGGDKSTQAADIRAAQTLARSFWSIFGRSVQRFAAENATNARNLEHDRFQRKRSSSGEPGITRQEARNRQIRHQA